MSDGILEAVCRIQEQFRPMFAVNLVLFVILLLLLPFVERGSATFFVSIFGLVIIGGTLLGWTALRYKCKQVQAEKTWFLE